LTKLQTEEEKKKERIGWLLGKWEKVIMGLVGIGIMLG